MIGEPVPGPAAIANAVADALGGEGSEITQVPIRAYAVVEHGGPTTQDPQTPSGGD